MNIYRTADIIGLGIQLDSASFQLPFNGNIVLSVPDVQFDNLILSRKFTALDANQLSLRTNGGNTILVMREFPDEETSEPVDDITA